MMDSPRRPQVFVIAGPNGAGKTTAAPWLLRDELGVPEFVNADVIAQGISGFAPESATIEAGRVMAQRIKSLSERRADFAFETTLAGRTLVKEFSRLGELGYDVNLLYLWLPSADIAVERVRHRVARGGHGIPESTVRRRYGRSVRNFDILYRPLATRWRLYDASPPGPPALVAYGERDMTTVVDAMRWDEIRRRSTRER